jgi:hypothetical protein
MAALQADDLELHLDGMLVAYEEIVEAGTSCPA